MGLVYKFQHHLVGQSVQFVEEDMAAAKIKVFANFILSGDGLAPVIFFKYPKELFIRLRFGKLR